MHRLIEAAGRRGEFPDWAKLTERRRGHVERVAALMAGWAEELGLAEDERVRWRAAGRLHDALKDAATTELRELVAQAEWPEPLLHAPAAAERLARDGVADEEFLLAIAYHSVGHPSFRELGEHLYLADFLEPGRAEDGLREELRRVMPGERTTVLRRVIRSRIEHQLDIGCTILPETVEFWNRTVAA